MTSIGGNLILCQISKQLLIELILVIVCSHVTKNYSKELCNLIISILDLEIQRAARMKKELHTVDRDPPHGVSCWLQTEDKLDVAKNSLKRERNEDNSEVISNKKLKHDE